MPIIKGLEWTFDTVAAAYEKWRPGYPGSPAGPEADKRNPQKKNPSILQKIPFPKHNGPANFPPAKPPAAFCRPTASDEVLPSGQTQRYIKSCIRKESGG